MYKELLEKFASLQESSSEAYIERYAQLMLEKIAKDTSVAADILAGIDPTLILTFNAAQKNEGDHLKHRAIQDTSSFISGAGADVAMTTAGTGLLALALKNRNPELLEEFMANIKRIGKKTTESDTKKIDPMTAAAAGAGVLGGAVEAFSTDKQYQTGLRAKQVK